MNKLFFLLLFPVTIASQVPECSGLRKAFLDMEFHIASEKQKNENLASAFHNFDYCATKYWLENGVKPEEALRKWLYMERGKWGVTTSFIKVALFTKPACREDMLQLLQKYGINDIHYIK